MTNETAKPNETTKTSEAGETISKDRVESGQYAPFLSRIPELAGVAPLGSLEPLPNVEPVAKNSSSNHDLKRRSLNRLAEIREQWDEKRHGPQGEKKSKAIVGRVKMIPLEEIVADNDFKNEIRLDPTPEEAHTLKESMRYEGLKVPVVVMEAAVGDKYHLRWGFRRTRAARELGWDGIPAIVLPPDTTLPTQYWANILENLARSKMHTYELARAAQLMRDKFRIDYREFAKRSGYEPKYIDNLLRAIDRLPPELVQKWRERRPIPVDYYFQWSAMQPEEAIRAFQIYVGLHPRAQLTNSPPLPATGESSLPPEGENTENTEGPKKKRGDYPFLASTRAGLKRMDRLRFAIAAHPKMDDEVRKLCITIVDCCMGIRNDVPGIYDASKRQHHARFRQREKDVAGFKLVGPDDPLVPTPTDPTRPPIEPGPKTQA